jgi:hypothetical protein
MLPSFSFYFGMTKCMFPMNQSNRIRPFGYYCSKDASGFLSISNHRIRRNRAFRLAAEFVSNSDYLSPHFLYSSSFPSLFLSPPFELCCMMVDLRGNESKLIQLKYPNRLWFTYVGLKRRFSEDEEMDLVATDQAVSLFIDPPQHLYQHTQNEWKRNKTGIAKQSRLNRKLGKLNCWIHPLY